MKKDLKAYFASYPILRLKMHGTDNYDFYYNWYPSEYLYREKESRYCLAAEEQGGTQVMMGGSMIR
jgi:hypothetical protein